MPARALAIWGWFLGALLGAGLPCRAALCVGPEALEARVRGASSAAAETELGSWFGTHQEFSCAVGAYREAVRIDPHSRVALHGLAKALLATGDSASAIAVLRPAPREEELTLDLAEAYGRAGAPEKAAAVLVAGLRAQPGSARMTSALVVILANNGHAEDAFRLAQQFVKQHPQDLEGQKLYLRVLVATNQATAAPLARKLLAASPQDGELLFLNGLVEQKAGELSAAKIHLQESIAVNAGFAESRYNLGLVLARLQDAAGAKEQLEKAIALGATEPEAHLELSKALRTVGETAKADAELTIYQEALKTNVNREVASSKSADAAAALASGDAGKAVQFYREALEATPQDGGLEYQLALALDKAGDKAGERAALDKAVTLEPGAALAQHQLGYVLYTGGEYDAAEEHFRLAVKDDPQFTQAWISLAATLATKSRPTEAQEALGRALRLDPHNVQAQEMKKQLIAAQGSH